MVFLVAAVLASGILLWFYDKSHFTALGFQPNLHRLTAFGFGLVTSSLLAGVGFYTVAIVSNATVTLNPDFTSTQFLESSWWMARSVLTEELLFRGALLYIAIKIMGIHRACMLSSIAFGVYHWFSYGVFGQVTPMIYVFLLTGVGGLLFAYSFAITKSMYLPVGLHLGWNIVSVVVFSQGPLGNQLLVASGGEPLGLWSIAFFVYQVTALPFLTFLYLRRELALSK